MFFQILESRRLTYKLAFSKKAYGKKAFWRNKLFLQRPSIIKFWSQECSPTTQHSVKKHTAKRHFGKISYVSGGFVIIRQGKAIFLSARQKNNVFWVFLNFQIQDTKLPQKWQEAVLKASPATSHCLRPHKTRTVCCL